MLQKILSKIEPHLPAQFKEIAEHFSYVFALRILQQFISFVSFFFIINHVPKDVIGHYQFVLSVIALVSIFSLPGIRNALMQSVARHQGGFFNKATKLSFLGSVVGSLFLLFIAAYHLFIADFFMAIAFIIAALMMPFSHGLLSWRSSYAGEERFKMLSIIEASATLILSVMLTVGICAGDRIVSRFPINKTGVRSNGVITVSARCYKLSTLTDISPHNCEFIEL